MKPFGCRRMDQAGPALPGFVLLRWDKRTKGGRLVVDLAIELEVEFVIEILAPKVVFVVGAAGAGRRRGLVEDLGSEGSRLGGRDGRIGRKHCASWRSNRDWRILTIIERRD